MQWSAGSRTFLTGDKPLIMGIVNVTPDSFSDGGRYHSRERAVAHGRALAAAGADILDVGGESTRPGAEPVSPEEEARRVLPVIRELADDPRIVISVDTCKASVAACALEAGACIVNDVTGLQGDPKMVSIVKETGAGAVVMHMQGTPRSMQASPSYRDVVTEVASYLRGRLQALQQAGLAPEQLALDPGIGFGKTLEHNLDLLAHLDALHLLQRPLVIGLSRKRFLGELTGRAVGDRLAGTLAGAAYCLLHGAQILRVHDVAETVDVARVLWALNTRKEAGAE